MTIRILGLDPGLATCGYALANYDTDRGLTPVSMGVILTEKSDKKRKVRDTDDNFRRAQEVVRALDPLFAEVDVVVAEEMSSPRNARTVKLMGMGWGIIATLADIYEHPVVHIPVDTIKKKLGGSGQASKAEVIDGVNTRFGEDLADRLLTEYPRGKHEHPYDALAAIVCSLETDVIRMAMKVKVDG